MYPKYCYTKLGRCPPSQSSIDALNTTTPNLADLHIYRTMHIYLWQITPLQSSIYAINTITPNVAHIYIEQCTYTHGRLTPLPPIEHRCLQYCYTKLGRSIHLEQCIYTHGRLIPQSLKHRCLEYCYTKLGRCPPSQLTIDALTTTTPNLADVLPSQSSIDALNTTTPNLADVPPVN